MRAILFILVVFAPLTAHAAELRMRVSPAAEGVWYEFFLDSEGVSINAIEGTIDVREVREVRHGNSIVTLWLEAPSETDGALRFSGITPGGFTGSDGALFSVRADDMRPTLTEGSAYLDDGSGTAVGLKFAELAADAAVTDTIDVVPPQEFVPILGSDPSIGEGNHFVSFLAQDKQTGVARYEIAETRAPQWLYVRGIAWKAASSPHVLSDQTLRSFIYMRAIDAAGNERAVRLAPARGIFSHGLLPTGIALAVVIAGILLISTYALSLGRRR